MAFQRLQSVVFPAWRPPDRRRRETAALPLRIATWNVNSVRLRLEGIARLVADHRPDVLCLQETKVTNELFPVAAIEELGFPYHALHGQPGYHGVATFSSRPILDANSIEDWCGKDHCRHQHLCLEGGIELHNLYIPAGGDIPDPAVNDKFAHKLNFLRALTAWLAGHGRPRAPTVLLGDLNIAPLETDVWSHRQLLKVVSHTPVEVEALDRLQASAGWIDAVRRMIPPEIRLYSWWSYRAQDWSASDRGRRLDHLWVTPDLAERVAEATVLRPARGWPRPSDHVPVIVELADCA
jgi:exodeoxyribonuclease-3